MTFFKKNKILTIILIIFSIYVYCNYTKVVSGNNLINKNSEAFVNSLYMSDERIYNDYLTANEKKMYKTIFNGIKNKKRKININLYDYDCFNSDACVGLVITAFEAITVDHPEILNFSSLAYEYTDDDFSILLKYPISFKFMEYFGERKIEIIIDKIKEETKNMSDKEKILYVYDWIGENTKYDYAFMFSSKNQSIYSVFIDNNSVCAGFAKASQVIFQNIGINSYVVPGFTSDGHMWNLIEYEGKYYFFDSTVAAGLGKKSKYYYDGLYQEKMKDYEMDYPLWYPFIETSEFSDNI